ncbi:MAG: hypothetical protein Q7Q73_07695 [Verrucomicrobiota bacterium JB024]|nr:hypothetical protein [Verrucomicrobiota bacterium JB024]
MNTLYPTRLRNLVFPCVLAGFVCFSALSAHATLIAYDTFTTDPGGYTVDTNIFGQSSTIETYGFTGVWGGTNSNFFTSRTLGMQKDGVITSSGVVRLSTSSGLSRSDNRGFNALAGQSTLWFGSYMRVDANALTPSNGAELMFGFTSGGVPLGSTDSATGALWSTSNGGSLSGFQWGVSSSNSLVVKYQSGSNTVDTVDSGFVLSSAYPTTYFLVAQLLVNESGNDTLNVWVLTSTPVDESAILSITPTLTVSSADILSNSSELDTLLLNSGATGSTSSLSFDDTHIGTTYADLTSIPEPAEAAGLAGALAVLAVFLARRRR